MQLGMIGLGRMGANIVRRLMRDGHECVVFDNSPESIKALEAEGATGALTLEEFAAKLTVPRAAWVMIPASVTGQVVEQVAAQVDGLLPDSVDIGVTIVKAEPKRPGRTLID